jgi:nucleotide-binding universal stress UspA family protein
MNERRILVAYDGTEEAYWALMQAADAALASGASIGVVTVLPKLATAATDAADILREHELEPTLHTPIGDPATEIARIAHEHAYDAIYVGRRENGSLVRALEGSVSEGVVQASAQTTVIAR